MRFRNLVTAISLVIAAVFAYASISKIIDPLDFADSIFGFAMLPNVLITPLALALPPFEIACAVLLIVPRTRRIGGLAVVLVTLMFTTALLSALLRGLTLDCGCFGTGAPSRPRMWLEVGLDVVLLGGAALVYLGSGSIWFRMTLPAGHEDSSA